MEPTTSGQEQRTHEATPGRTTFFPESGPARPDRLHARLLGLIAFLLTLLVLGLAVAGIWAMREYARFQGALATRGDSLEARVGDLADTSRALAAQATARQAALSARLTAENRALSAQLTALERQRQALGVVPDDPFGKADYAIRVSQLTLAQLSLNNRFWASTQRVLAEGIAPLPAQRETSLPGSNTR